MGIIRNAANTLIKGRVGQTTYYISKGQQVARQARNDSNYGDTARRTQLQQERRILWANLVNFYKISARWMPKAFESKRVGQTDYNKFMAINVPTARIALTKSESEAAACVVDTFLVSQGSLPSIEISQDVDGYLTNIGVGNLTIDETTTIAQFTTAAIANNANIREGMQLSFVQYTQSVDPLGTPRAICRCYEVTLSTTSSAPLRNHLPEICTQVVDGYLATVASPATGGFTYILSELQGGALKVSTQQLVTINFQLISQYTSASQISAAIQSYGLDQEVVLNPNGSVSQQEEGIPNYIQSVSWLEGDMGQEYTVTKYPGQVFGEWNDIRNKQLSFNCSGLDNQTFVSATLYDESGISRTVSEGTLTGQTIKCTFDNIDAGSHRKVIRFVITLSDGLVLQADFLAE